MTPIVTAAMSILPSDEMDDDPVLEAVIAELT
jgi:hypothetical protein